MPFGKVAGKRDDNPHAWAHAEDFATGSPRPVVVRICVEAGLLADGGPVIRLAVAAPSRAPLVKEHAQWPCRNITVHSCGGSRGLDRVPFLASANAEEPRRRKATQGVGAGQSPQVSSAASCGHYREQARRSEERRVGKECVRTGRSRWCAEN